MRSVRIVVRQLAGSVPALVAASVFGATACDDGMTTPNPSPGGGGSGVAGSGTAGTIVISTGGDISLGGSASYVPAGCEGYVIELPDPGLPADPGQICAISMEPVMDGAAARVTLTAMPDELNLAATGRLTLAASLLDSVASAPAVQLVQSTDPKLLQATLSELTPSDDGYTFTISWPEGVLIQSQDTTRLVFRTAVELGCETGTRLVHALTEVHLCGGFFNGVGEVPAVWASSGDNCAVCRVIAELAASPILPGPQASGLPLGQAMRARVVELARVGESVVLFAENDGGEVASYEWHASAGTLEHIAPDVVIWHLPAASTTRSLQVAVVSEDGAAVVSYEFEGGMH